jgi:hypothetical protein
MLISTRRSQVSVPAGRLLVLEGDRHVEQPIVLSEFGGITLSPDVGGTWGYSRVETSERLADRYSRLLTVVHSLSLFAGFCYTQFADTYQEANGLLWADRTPKCPLDIIAAATTGRLAHTEEAHRHRDPAPVLTPAPEEPERSSDGGPV